MYLLLQLAIIIIASKVAGSLSVRLGQPSVLGKLLVGVLLGSSVLGLINESETLHQFSEIGVILLMFIAGLETDLDQFKRTGKASTFVGFGGIIFPLVLGYFAGTFIGLSTMEAWFLGLLLSATSVSISVQALKELKQINSREGTTILGAAVIDDVVVIIALAFLMSFAGDDVNLVSVIGVKVLYFVAALLVAWKVVPWFMRHFSSLRVTQTVVSSALIICFVFAYTAELTGVAGIIGAYMAGVAIGQTSYQHETFVKIETIGYSIFVPVFFTSVGLSAQFSGIVENLWLTIGLCVLAVATKLVGAAVGAKLSGFNLESALAIGAAMVSRGEVALILATIGLQAGLVTDDMFAVLIVVVLFTTLVTPPMMKYFFKPAAHVKAPLHGAVSHD